MKNITYEYLCDLKNIYLKTEKENTFYNLFNTINSFLTNKYPELYEYINTEDKERLVKILEDSSDEKDFIISLIYTYVKNNRFIF